MNDIETLGEVVDRLAKEETDCFSTEHAINLTMLTNVVKRVARNAYLAGQKAGRGEEGNPHE